MKILGNRIYLNLPDIKESNFSISDDLKKELRNKELEKFDRLTVFAISESEEVKKQGISVGDEVYVDPMGAKRGVILKIEGSEKISVSLFDVMHIW